MTFLQFVSRQYRFTAITIFSFLFCIHPVQAQQTLTYSMTNNPTEELIVDLLELGMRKNHQAANYQLTANRMAVNEARKVQMLKDGEIDIVWMGTSKEYERQLFPIRIPILKGMLGHRIFIIRQGEQEKFNAINNLAQLRDIPLGQGKFWGDTAVLKHAGLKVVDPVKYESLFHMLEGERFDYFPRALHEPWSEVAGRAELNLTVESKHLVIYPFALYYFVSPEKPELGELLLVGLRTAIADGSYDEVFYNHPVIKETLLKSQLSERIIHRLANPNMSAETPVDDETLWLDINNL